MIKYSRKTNYYTLKVINKKGLNKDVVYTIDQVLENNNLFSAKNRLVDIIISLLLDYFA